MIWFFRAVSIALIMQACHSGPESLSTLAVSELPDQKLINDQCRYQDRQVSHRQMIQRGGVAIVTIEPDSCGAGSNRGAYSLSGQPLPERMAVLITNTSSLANHMGPKPTAEEVAAGRKKLGWNPSMGEWIMSGDEFSQENTMQSDMDRLRASYERRQTPAVMVDLSSKPEGVSTQQFIEQAIDQRLPEDEYGQKVRNVPADIVYLGHGNIDQATGRHVTGGEGYEVPAPGGGTVIAPTQREASRRIRYQQSLGKPVDMRIVENEHFTTDVLQAAETAVNPDVDGQAVGLVVSCHSGQIVAECQRDPALRQGFQEIVTSSPADASTKGQGILEDWAALRNGDNPGQQFDIDRNGVVTSGEFAFVSGRQQKVEESRGVDFVMSKIVTTRPSDGIPGSAGIPSVRTQKERDQKFIEGMVEGRSDNTPQTLEGDMVLIDLAE